MTEITRENFAPWLRKKIAISGRTQVEIAAAVNVAQHTVSGWADGCRLPRVGARRNIFKFFGLTHEQGYYEVTSETDSESRAA
jgi:hypothetical protein